MTETRQRLPQPRPHEEPPPTARTSSLRLALVAAGIAALGYFGGLPILIVVLAIVVMIFLHELGHYLTARWAGMKVTEFFIGFGPRIWSYHRGETEYGLKAIPAGAYVRIIGMHNLDEVDPADEPRTYRQKPYWRRMSVALAGSAMHFLIALVLLFVIFVGFGVPDEGGWQVRQVVPAGEGASPAGEAGVEVGDRIVAVEGNEVDDFDALRAEVAARPGETVDLTVERDGTTFETSATLAEAVDADGRTVVTEEGEPVGFLGVSAEVSRERLGVIESTGRAFSDFGRLTAESGKALGRFFTPSGLSSFADQVFAPAEEPPEGVTTGSTVPADEAGEERLVSIYGAARIGAQAAETGAVGLLSFLVLINIFIGIFNLVPLLPLDGGHVAIATYERLRSRGGERYYVDVRKLLPVTYAVVVVLITIGVAALYLDIANPIDLPN